MVRDKLPYIKQKTAKTTSLIELKTPKPKRYHLRAYRTSRQVLGKQGKGISMDKPGAGMRSVNETEYVDQRPFDGALIHLTYTN